MVTSCVLGIWGPDLCYSWREMSNQGWGRGRGNPGSGGKEAKKSPSSETMLFSSLKSKKV